MKLAMAITGFTSFALGCIGVCGAVAFSAYAQMPLGWLIASEVAMVVGALLFIRYGTMLDYPK